MNIEELNDAIVARRDDFPFHSCEQIARHIQKEHNVIVSVPYVSEVLRTARS